MFYAKVFTLSCVNIILLLLIIVSGTVTFKSILTLYVRIHIFFVKGALKFIFEVVRAISDC